jgi:hypothetical protein
MIGWHFAYCILCNYNYCTLASYLDHTLRVRATYTKICMHYSTLTLEELYSLFHIIIPSGYKSRARLLTPPNSLKQEDRH